MEVCMCSGIYTVGIHKDKNCICGEDSQNVHHSKAYSWKPPRHFTEVSSQIISLVIYQIFSLDRPHPEVRREGWEPLPDKARESTLQSQSGGEKWLRWSRTGTRVPCIAGRFFTIQATREAICPNKLASLSLIMNLDWGGCLQGGGV